VKLQAPAGNIGSSVFTVSSAGIMPVVTPPAPIKVIGSVAVGTSKGATGAASPQLAAFLFGGTATDNCSTPTHLNPQVAGADVDNNTLFKTGKTTVTFRFIDGAGNIGTATSTVQVIAPGDVNGTGTVDVTDLVVLANYLAGNVPDSAPVMTNIAALDVNGDGKIDAVDMVILANYLAGNIPSLQ